MKTSRKITNAFHRPASGDYITRCAKCVRTVPVDGFSKTPLHWRRRFVGRNQGGYRMPMFEYFCPDCNVRFEKLVRRVTPEIVEGGVACPTCENTDTRRVLSVFAAVTASSKGAQMDGC